MRTFITMVSYLLIFSFIFSSCYNEQPINELASETTIQKVSVTEIKLVDKTFKNFDNFLKSESFEISKTNISGINIKSIHAISFDNEHVKGFIVRIDEMNGLSRDLMAVYKTETPEKFTTLLRESSIKTVNGEMEGSVYWYTATYDKLNEMTIKSNKISSFHLLTSDKPFSTKNARFASVQACSWQCTSQDFNCEYQSAKNECESDWQCDFACSFNPCAVAYLATAVVACTVC